MNIALILAGGNGSRTMQDIPKQFMCVYEKPVIVYTLEALEKHPDIDGIIVSCLEGWQDILLSYAKEAGISKLKWVVEGGSNGQGSTKHALDRLSDVCKEDDLIIIHDAVRPNISHDIISNAVAVCKKYGSAVAAVRCTETVIQTNDRKKGNVNINRDSIMRIQTPHVFPYGKLIKAHKQAAERGITNATTASSLLIELGETIYFSMGSEKNLKITTVDDLEIFKALCKVKKEEWIK